MARGYLTSTQAAQSRSLLRQSMIADDLVRYTYDKFNVRPRASATLGYGNPAGTTGAVNLLVTDRNVFEYAMLGAGQTLLIPAHTATGLDIALDQTADEGIEMTQGITARSRSAFVVGTDKAVVFRVKAAIADISGAAVFGVGWRKAAAYTADYNDYTDFAMLANLRGSTRSLTAVGNAATVNTDTTKTWADAAEHEFKVVVHKNGTVTYYVDGVKVTTVAYTFTAALTIVPFVYFLHHADLAGAVELREWECGYLF